jgi:hypothetical protein
MEGEREENLQYGVSHDGLSDGAKPRSRGDSLQCVVYDGLLDECLTAGGQRPR